MESKETKSAKNIVRDFISRNEEEIQKINEGAPDYVPQDIKKEILNISDRAKFQKDLNNAAIESARNISKQKECLDPSGGNIDSNGQTAKHVILTEKILDPTIPIKLKIAKRGKWAENGDFLEPAFSISIYKGDEFISVIAVREHEEEFVMAHREVNPRFRGQGIARIMINAAEELIKEYCKKVGRKAQIDAYVSQLDVMAMFDSYGYTSVTDREPERPHQFKTRESQMLSDVMSEVESDEIIDPNADSKYVLAERLYIQPRGGYPPKEQETDPRANDPVGRRIADAIRVHFRKDLEEEVSKERITDTQQQISRSVKTLL